MRTACHEPVVKLGSRPKVRAGRQGTDMLSQTYLKAKVLPRVVTSSEEPWRTRIRIRQGQPRDASAGNKIKIKVTLRAGGGYPAGYLSRCRQELKRQLLPFVSLSRFSEIDLMLLQTRARHSSRCESNAVDIAAVHASLLL